MNALVEEPIGVVGAGSWGTALAILLARSGQRVLLSGRDPTRLREMARARVNARYLPGISFPASLTVCPDASALAETDRLLLVVPSSAFAETCRQQRAARQRPLRTLTVVWGTKGFAPDSGRLLSEIVHEVFGEEVRQAVVSGPTFAREVASGLPTAFTSAAVSPQIAEEVASWFRGDRVRVYTSTDIAGVQLGGAIKNVMAIATGISDGLELGANARAALITRGLAELTRLGVALGGRAETFMGLAGLGDLVLTCTDDQSRNRRVGLGIGRGHALAEVIAEIGQHAEGLSAARELCRLGKRHALEMPIAEHVYRVLFEGLSPRDAVRALLEREPKPE